MLIQKNRCLILDLCMITNKILSLIAWKLVWFMICVCWVSIWMFIMFLVFDLILSKIFCVFVFFLVLICFWFNCLFCFIFGSNHDFRFGSGLSRCFRVYLISFVLGQVLRLCLVGYLFCWGIFGLRGCLTNISIGLFWQFCFE